MRNLRPVRTGFLSVDSSLTLKNSIFVLTIYSDILRINDSVFKKTPDIDSHDIFCVFLS